MHDKRRKIWIDKSQTRLMVRIAIYIVLMQATMVSACIIFEQFFNSVTLALGGGFNVLGMVFLAMFFIVPASLLLYDALQMMHRIVGPLYRFRKTMQAIAAGEVVDLVHLRKGDYLNEFQDDMNLMLQALADRGAVTLRAKPAPVELKLPEAPLSDAIRSARVSAV